MGFKEWYQNNKLKFWIIVAVCILFIVIAIVLFVYLFTREAFTVPKKRPPPNLRERFAKNDALTLDTEMEYINSYINSCLYGDSTDGYDYSGYDGYYGYSGYNYTPFSGTDTTTVDADADDCDTTAERECGEITDEDQKAQCIEAAKQNCASTSITDINMSG